MLDASLPGFDGGKDYRVFGPGLSVIDVAVQGDIAYVIQGADGPAGMSWGILAASDAGLLAVDVSDPFKPQEFGYFLTPRGVIGVEADDGIIYAADYQTGLFILILNR